MTKRNRIVVSLYENTRTKHIVRIPHEFVTVWEGEEYKPTCDPTIYITEVRRIRSRQAMKFFSREVYIRDLTTHKVGYL